MVEVGFFTDRMPFLTTTNSVKALKAIVNHKQLWTTRYSFDCILPPQCANLDYYWYYYNTSV